MNHKEIMLVLLLELWHLETMCACLMLLLSNLRRRRAEKTAIDNTSFVRHQTRLSYLDSIIGNSDAECINELRMDRRCFGLLCELLRTDGKIGSALNALCPGANLKVNPHIESKLKKLKKDYSLIYDMLCKSGFAWNDEKKCVEVDSNELWDMYVQHNKKANGWRNKPYPMYERLSLIFGKDRACGSAAEAPADMVDEQINNEDDVGVDNETSPLSTQNDGSHQSQVREKKRKVNDDDRIMMALEKLFEESNKRMQLVTDAIVKGNENRSDIANELKNMGLPILDQIEALKIILDKPQNISVFMSLDDEGRKVYVRSLLTSNASSST